MFFNYEVKDEEIEWLKDDAKAICTTLKSLDKKCATKRPLQDCPACNAVCLRKLADHLRCTHKFNKQQRDKYLAIARKVIIKLYAVVSLLYCLN